MKTNKNKLIGIIADESIDAGMLVWALYTLTQQPQYYYLGFEYWFDVSEALGEDSEGAFNIRVETDGVETIEQLDEYVKTLNDLEGPDGIHILVSRLHTTESNNELYSALVDKCDKVIVVSSFGVPNLHKTITSGNNVDNFLSEYFEEGKENWEDVYSLPWDRREYIALNFRPSNTITVQDKIDLTNEKIFIINLNNYHLNLLPQLPALCKFIGIPASELPKEAWELISDTYTKWKVIGADPTLWEMNLPSIIDSIINGYHMDLSPYKMDIIKESILLHELLYKHNMNIKGYGLNTLPANTKDIHNLLEENFHTLTAY